MESDSGALIRFAVNGQRFELSRSDVVNCLADVAPDTIRKHAVKVNGTWFPVIQAFEAATGIPRSEFISHTARRHLAALGFEVAGSVESRTAPEAFRATYASPSLKMSRGNEKHRNLAGEWHTEASVQASLVTALAAEGWRILSVANTATKEHGVDVIASRDGQTVGIEVKGFPSRGYADPARAHEVKRTSPSTQAGHWYSQALLAAMRLRGKEPTWRSVIALPDFLRYRDLHAETFGSRPTHEFDRRHHSIMAWPSFRAAQQGAGSHRRRGDAAADRVRWRHPRSTGPNVSGSRPAVR